MIKLRHLAAASAAVLTLAVAAPPASAQWIVYDPTNFSQNVLTAARELQQITNQITMLNNQATSLINQARNLANLPMSTLTQLQSSIAQTQSLLSQAQNISARCRRRRPATSSWRCNRSSSPIWSRCCRPRAGQMRSSKRAQPPPRRRANRTIRPSTRVAATCRATSPCSAAIEAPRCWAGRTHSASPR